MFHFTIMYVKQRQRTRLTTGAGLQMFYSDAFVSAFAAFHRTAEILR
jgi:hypothetical protein